MLTPQDVRAAQFEKNIRGYRTEEVDRFLDKVEEQLKQDEDQAEELRRQIAELTAENQRLHKEMENHHIKLAPWQVLHHCCHLFRASTEPAAPSRHSLPTKRLRRHAGQGARKRVSHNP